MIVECDMSVFDMHRASVFDVFAVVYVLSVYRGFLAVFDVNRAYDLVDEFCDTAVYHDVRTVLVVNVNAVFVDMYAVAVAVRTERFCVGFVVINRRLCVLIVIFVIAVGCLRVGIFRIRACGGVIQKFVKAYAVKSRKSDEIVRVGRTFRPFPFGYCLTRYVEFVCKFVLRISVLFS